MKGGRYEVGRRGEAAVCEYLTSHGHTVLSRNWRWGRLEVDIISLSSDGVHFTEVKSRVAPEAADPSESVRGDKQRNISRAAVKYMETAPPGIGDREIWLDVASVVFDGGAVKIDYIPGAYLPIYL